MINSTLRRTVGDNDFWKLASRNAPATKTAALALLRSAGFRAIDGTAKTLLDRVDEVRRLRLQRASRRIVARIGHEPTGTRPLGPARAPVLLPRGAALDRLHRTRVNQVTAAARQVLRHGAAGGHSLGVRLTDDPAAVGYTVTLDSNRDTYRGRFKGWSAREDHHRIVVPTDWCTRVLRRGLATLGGMLTLDAHALSTGHPDTQVYAAVWARQGQGFQVVVERGYIAVHYGESYHAETIERALRGVRRKTAVATKWTDDVSVSRFCARYSRFSMVAVCLDDARQTGACEYGIRAWCEAVGLPYAVGVATVGDVLAAYRRRPQVEVRRAVIHAVQRHRCDSGQP